MDDIAAKRLPLEIKAAIAKRSRSKGSNYEREVAKKFATYFGWNWNDCFIRTSPHAYAQPEGDLKPINEMRNLWIGANLGPLEAKNRMAWTFDQLFKTPTNSELYRYWKKSNEDCKSDNTLLVFTKNGVTDYVMIQSDIGQFSSSFCCPRLNFYVEGKIFTIITLKEFLSLMWPH
jgi:hypothetical protein